MVLTSEVQPAAKRVGKRKNQDSLPNPSKQQLRDVPHSRMYVEMRELELRIDQYVNRKKAEVCDINQPMDLQTRTLRLYLYNQHHNQGSQTAQPSWSFYMYGHYVEPPSTAQTSATPPSSATPPTSATPPMSAGADKRKDRFWTASMASIELRLEEQGPGAAPPEVVRWERNRHIGSHKEAIEVHRSGSRPTQIHITMHRDFAPEQLHVRGALAAALGVSSCTRGQLLRKVWDYITAHSTPDDRDPAIVTCDAAAVALFGVQRLQLASIGERLDGFLEQPQPVQLSYTVQLEGPSPAAPQCYDMEVAWPLSKAMLRLPAFLERFSSRQEKECEDCDKHIAKCMTVLKDCQRRYNFLMGFAAGPVEFMQKLVAASAKDVHEHGNEIRQISATESFQQPWAQEAVVHYLLRNQAAGHS